MLLTTEAGVIDKDSEEDAAPMGGGMPGMGGMEVATKTNDVAGDGTTTATLLAQAIIREGFKNLAAGEIGRAHV